LDGFGYTGAGEDTNFLLQNDFWKYDPITDTWIQVANFPGAPRKHATAFALSGKGYAGTGLTDTGLVKDFWQYDPVLNGWTQIQDLGQFSSTNIFPKRDMSASTWLNHGYVMCGYDGTMGYSKQLFSFNPAADTMWQKKKNFTNVTDATILGRRWGVSFNLGNLVYYGTGYSSSNDCKNDLWSYDPIRDLWTQMADMTGEIRSNAVAFTAYNYGYVGGGSNDKMTPDFFRYNGTSNSWTYVTDFPLKAANQISFTINNRVFVGLGNDSLGRPVTDFYEFIPDSTIGFDDASDESGIRLYPTVIKNYFTVEFIKAPSSTTILSLYDLQGKLIDQFSLTAFKNILEKKLIYTGICLYAIRQQGKTVKTGKVIFEN
jgi:N-acetylneuraminic acid mutarotase